MERKWRDLLEASRGYVKPVAHPLSLIPNARGRNPFNRECFKLDCSTLPDRRCVYVMRYVAGQILRIGTAEKGLRDRFQFGYNRPYPASHPTWTIEKVYVEYETWAGGAHLTNALVLHALAHDVRKYDLEIEVYAFRGSLLAWERRMLDLYVEVFGSRPVLDRGWN